MPFHVNLKEKVALVTGASSGLGARFAKVLAASGANVVLAARRVDRLKELRAEIEAAGCAAHVTALDVTDTDSIRAAIDEAESHAGQIDILVNNAGVSTTQRLTEVSEADYDHVMNVNLKGAFFVAQEVGRRMIAHAQGNSGFHGRIIHIASTAGLRAVSQLGLYSISKAALIHMTKAQALEWGRHHINVNAICPGLIRTEMNDEHWQTEAGQKLLNMLPRKRLGQPSDLDGLLLLLASDEAKLINGAVISADDGFSVA